MNRRTLLRSALALGGVAMMEVTDLTNMQINPSETVEAGAISHPLRIKRELMAWWDFNEVSGAVRVDATGRGNDLIDHGSVASASGLVGQAAKFAHASDNYLTHPSNTDLQAGVQSFTWALWIRIDAARLAPIIIKTVATVGGDREYYLQWDNFTPVYEFGVGNGTTLVSMSSVISVPVGSWTFVVAWMDLPNSTLNLQINNGAVESLFRATLPDGIAYTNNADLAFGHFLPADNLSSDASLDSVGYWHRILTNAERTWLYNKGFGRKYEDL